MKHLLDCQVSRNQWKLLSLLLLSVSDHPVRLRSCPVPPNRYLLLGTHQLPLNAFEGSLRFLGETDIDIDEVQCIVANLIDKVHTRAVDLV